MAIIVRIPTPLQKLTKNQPEVKADAKSIKELIDTLEKNFPGIKDRICDEKGNVRRFINIYVNEEDVRFLQQDATPLKDGDEVSIIPAIAGGGSTHFVRPSIDSGRTLSEVECVRSPFIVRRTILSE